MAIAALTFVSTGQYVNPSRFDPLLVTIRPADNSYLALQANLNGFAIFVSTVIVRESYIVDAKKIGKSASLKYLSGIFHAAEWERACSFFCMAFGSDRLTAQVCLSLLCCSYSQLFDRSHTTRSTFKLSTVMKVCNCLRASLVY